MKNKILLSIVFLPIIIFAQYADAGRLYFKGMAGFGFVQDKLDAGVRISEDGVITKEIYISPGGGLNIEWGMGLHISPSLKTELNVAYQYSGDRFNNGTVIFRRFPVSMSIVKEYQRTENYFLYGKIGVLEILTPKYSDELNGSKYNIDYKSAPGGHIGIGLTRRRESEKIFFFIEGNYIFGKKINWKSAKLDDIDKEPSESFKSLKNEGVFINIGLGYYY